MPPFRAQLSLGKYAKSLVGYDRIAWCGSRFLPTNSEVRTRKGFRREILGFVLAFTRVFVLEQDFTHVWGGTSSIFGRYSSKIPSSGTRHATFFCGTILAWGGTFLAWKGTSGDLGRDATPKCSTAAPGLLCATSKFHFKSLKFYT